MSDDTGENDRFQVEVFGISIGTADGWEDCGDFGQQYANFIPNEKFKGILHENVIAIDPFTGLIAQYSDDEIEEIVNVKEFLTLLLTGME